MCRSARAENPSEAGLGWRAGLGSARKSRGSVVKSAEPRAGCKSRFWHAEEGNGISEILPGGGTGGRWVGWPGPSPAGPSPTDRPCGFFPPPPRISAGALCSSRPASNASPLRSRIAARTWLENIPAADACRSRTPPPPRYESVAPEARPPAGGVEEILGDSPVVVSSGLVRPVPQWGYWRYRSGWPATSSREIGAAVAACSVTIGALGGASPDTTSRVPRRLGAKLSARSGPRRQRLSALGPPPTTAARRNGALAWAGCSWTRPTRSCGGGAVR